MGKPLTKTGLTVPNVVFISRANGSPGLDHLSTILLVIPGKQSIEEAGDRLVIVAPVKVFPEIFVQHGVHLVTVQQGVQSQSVGEPGLVLLNGQKQEHAVVIFGGAHAPVVKELIGVLVGIHTVKIVHGDHNDLGALTLLFKGAVVVNDHLLRVIGENVGIVGNIEALALIHHRKSADAHAQAKKQGKGKGK